MIRLYIINSRHVRSIKVQKKKKKKKNYNQDFNLRPYILKDIRNKVLKVPARLSKQHLLQLHPYSQLLHLISLDPYEKSYQSMKNRSKKKIISFLSPVREPDPTRPPITWEVQLGPEIITSQRTCLERTWPGTAEGLKPLHRQGSYLQYFFFLKGIREQTPTVRPSFPPFAPYILYTLHFTPFTLYFLCGFLFIDVHDALLVVWSFEFENSNR